MRNQTMNSTSKVKTASPVTRDTGRTRRGMNNISPRSPMRKVTKLKVYSLP